MNPSPHPVSALPIIILLITLGYFVSVLLRPFKTCRRCHGYGRIPTRTGRGRPRPCRKCRGSGLRPRTFRRPSRAARRLLSDARADKRP